MRSLTMPGAVASKPARRHEGSVQAIDPGRVPIAVVDLDVDEERLRAVGGDALELPLPSGDVMALVRRHGRPVGLLFASFSGSPDAGAELAALARSRFRAAIARHDAADLRSEPVQWWGAAEDAPGPGCAIRRVRSLASPPLISVAVATRERTTELARCLDSLLRMSFPAFEIIVVDNAPATDDTARLVHERYGDRVVYLREPVRGLASAHNRALTAASGDFIAFTDDDVVVDPQWLAAIAEAFADGPAAGCVTGLILPARLETTAQAMLERRGGFGKGFERMEQGLATPGTHPLFPFTAGRLGSGANMAFSARALREIGGFDPATGTGTTARGGDDLLAFFRTAVAGWSVVYQPDALVWHHHREERAALARQAWGYGVGLGAYLTAALVHEPRMLAPLLRRLPRGIAYAAQNSRPDTAEPGAWPANLARRERLGLAAGPVAYALSRRRLKAVLAAAAATTTSATAAAASPSASAGAGGRGDA